jgi:hypothetical protein
MVVEPTLYNGTQPSPDIGNWGVPPTSKFFFDATQLGSQSLSDRLTLNNKPAVF